MVTSFVLVAVVVSEVFQEKINIILRVFAECLEWEVTWLVKLCGCETSALSVCAVGRVL